MTDIGRVLVTAQLSQVAVDLLSSKTSVTLFHGSPQEMLNVLPEYDALLGKVHVDTKFLDAAGSRLKVISTPSAGYDHLDVNAIKKRGIKIGYTPRVLSAAVAEIAIFLLLGAARRTHEGLTMLQKGKAVFGFTDFLGHDLRGKTVGIVGLGGIGVEIVKRLKPFEIKRFIYSGHSRKKIGDTIGAEFVSQDALLSQSDFVVVCAPLTPETNKMFNDNAFKKMKKTAVFVNIARGELVDTDALVRALKNHVIFAAGLDVTHPEPLPVNHELFKLPNVVITPHLGTATVETRTDMSKVAVQNVINGLEGKPLLYEL